MVAVESSVWNRRGYWVEIRSLSHGQVATHKYLLDKPFINNNYAREPGSCSLADFRDSFDREES